MNSKLSKCTCSFSFFGGILQNRFKFYNILILLILIFLIFVIAGGFVRWPILWPASKGSASESSLPVNPTVIQVRRTRTTRRQSNSNTIQIINSSAGATLVVTLVLPV